MVRDPEIASSNLVPATNCFFLVVEVKSFLAHLLLGGVAGWCVLVFGFVLGCCLEVGFVAGLFGGLYWCGLCVV